MVAGERHVQGWAPADRDRLAAGGDHAAADHLTDDGAEFGEAEGAYVAAVYVDRRSIDALRGR